MPTGSPLPANGNYARDIALLHQTQEAHDRQIVEQGRRMDEGFRNVFVAIDSIKASINESKQTNWPLLISFATIVFALLGGGWMIIKLQTDNTVAPVVAAAQLTNQSMSAMVNRQEKMEDVQQRVRLDLDANTARDSVSEDDRRKLNTNLAKLAEQCQQNDAQRREENATTRASLAEIETQFAAMGNVQNMRAKHAEQLTGLIWSKVFGTNLPDGYTPFDISNRSAKTP